MRVLTIDTQKVQVIENNCDRSDETPMRLARSVALAQEAKNDDSAFYIAQLSTVVRKHNEWMQLLPRVRPFYAIKCNNDPVLIRMLAALGCGFDCASKAEIELAQTIVDSATKDIIFANPCKTRNFIAFAERNGVNVMTFDNEEELVKVAPLAPNAKMVVRINVADKSAQCQLSIKFGCCPTSQAPNLLRRARELGIVCVGVSFHVGSGCRDASVYAEAISHARNLFELGEELGHPMDLLDIGGGFPGHDDGNATFAEIAQVVNRALVAHFPIDEKRAKPVRVIAEPGRYFGAAAFTLSCTIMARTTTTRGRIEPRTDKPNDLAYMCYINDGVYGSFNCVLYDHSHVTPLVLFPERSTAPTPCPTAIWGPTCDGLDLVVDHCNLPALAEGDWLTFANMGAYTMAAGSTFNGFPRPSVHYYIDEEHAAILSSILSSEKIGGESGIESATSDLD